MAKPIRIIVHHTALAGNQSQLLQVNTYHKMQDFPESSLGWFVGYTYFIEKSGQVTQTRADTEMQAHTKGMNEDSIGLALAGDFNRERPTNEQLTSLRNLINQKMAEHGILPNNIMGHRMFRQTTCPGINFSEQEFRNLFQPNRVYYQKLLENLRQMLLNMKQKFGKANKDLDDYL